ncbi:MAG: TRAM domain-containing protein [Micrococcales bacterium]|nr:TRAM domain-containing protein [Micrococcales bacterium]
MARLDGQVVFVRLALPGERVRVQLTARRAKFLRADVVEVLEASPDRVAHPWPEAVAGQVGGMDMGHVAPAAARAAKAGVVRDQLRHQAGVDWPVEVAAVGDGLPTGWRGRVDLSADDGGNLGMFRPKSRSFVSLSSLPMAVASIQAMGLFDRVFPPGRVTAVAPSDSEPFVVSGGQVAPRRRELVEVGGACFRYQLDGLGFWQPHVAAPACLVGAVLDGAGAGDLAGATIWDLYCGSGLFTVPLAGAVGQAGQVVGVEAGRQAALDARANLAIWGDRVKVIRADVAAALQRDIGARRRRRRSGTGPEPSDLLPRPDLVVLDPPRAGVGAKVVAALVEAAPARVVYVSCEPSTLARDLAGLLAGGYQVADLAGFDLFPGTWHVETVTTLVR